MNFAIQSALLALAVVTAAVVPTKAAVAVTPDTVVWDFGLLPGPESMLSFYGGSAIPGEYTRWYTFEVPHAAAGVITALSTTFDSARVGTDLVSIALYGGDQTSLLSDGSIVSTESGPGMRTFWGVVSYLPFAPGQQYAVKIVGFSHTESPTFAARISTQLMIPEPSTGWLLVGGVGFLGYAVRAKRRAGH
jgi:hypothetical protein